MISAVPRSGSTVVSELLRPSVVALSMVAVMIGGCGGDSGVGSGRIQGKVLAVQSGFSSASPVSGVAITAQRLEGTPILRTSVSNNFGNYQFDKLPGGAYELVFAGSGFTSANGSQPVRVFVEPDRVSQVPDVLVTPGITQGSSVVIVSVVDAVTGQPVNGATVTVGTASTTAGSNGTYSLFVPVTPGIQGQPAAQRVLVNDSAHLAGSEQPSTIIPIANQTVAITVRVSPSQSVVQGVVRASAFDGLYRQNGTYSRLSITSDSIDPGFLNPIIDGGTGQFSVRVPSSSAASSTRFSLIFSGQGFFVKVLSNLIAPTTGATSNLSSDVILEPTTVTLEGNVITSSGSLPAGLRDQVTVVELGQVAPVVNGVFLFSRVPAAIPLTLRASATDPFRGVIETGLAQVTVAENGTGRFVMGAIQTR